MAAFALAMATIKSPNRLECEARIARLEPPIVGARGDDVDEFGVVIHSKALQRILNISYATVDLNHAIRLQ